MSAERGGRLVPCALEAGLAVLVALGVWWLWPRLAVPRLGAEEVWFALAWLVILAGPVLLSLWWRPAPQEELVHTFRAEALSTASFLLAGLFLALLVAAPRLGNYKLWLGVVYLAAVTIRLAGLSLWLRAAMPARPAGHLPSALAAAALAAAAALLFMPWVRPELVRSWPPAAAELGSPLAAAVLWGAISGAVLLVLRLWGSGRRSAWLAYLAVALGPGPTLALTWFGLLPMTAALAGLAGLVILRLLLPASSPPPPRTGLTPMSLYWLLRALVLLWWGMGLALALTAAWWYPRMNELVARSMWLRALGLGGFVVACLGLLAEYSLPLIGRAGLGSAGPRRKVLGVILSALALQLAFSPLLLTRPARVRTAPTEFLAHTRAELVERPLALGPEREEIVLEAPAWLTGLTRVYLVSLLTNGVQVRQGETVAQLVAVDDQDLPHIFNLRAGIDTAEWALDKREVAATAQHRPTWVARSWTVYTATGEAFQAHSYLTGLYLGRKVQRLKYVRLRYRYQNRPGRPPVRLEVRRLYLY